MLCSYGPVWYDEEAKTAGRLQPYGSYRMHWTRTGTGTGTGTIENKNVYCPLLTVGRHPDRDPPPLDRDSPWTETPLGQRTPTMDRQKPVKTLPLQTLCAGGIIGSLSLS